MGDFSEWESKLESYTEHDDSLNFTDEDIIDDIKKYKPELMNDIEHYSKIIEKIKNNETLNYIECLEMRKVLSDSSFMNLVKINEMINYLGANGNDRARMPILGEIVLTLKSDHDGYCSGNECELEPNIEYNLEFYDENKQLRKIKTSYLLNCSGSGQCYESDEIMNYYAEKHAITKNIIKRFVTI